MLLLLLSCSSPAIASEPIELAVWPGEAPDEKGDVGDEYIRPSPVKGEPARVFFNVREAGSAAGAPMRSIGRGAKTN